MKFEKKYLFEYQVDLGVFVERIKKANTENKNVLSFFCEFVQIKNAVKIKEICGLKR